MQLHLFPDTPGSPSGPPTGPHLAQPMIDSPLRWAGGKSRLRRQILPHFPAHTTYAEPFGGGAWVLLGKTRSAAEVYNDLDAELVNFFRVVQQDPQPLINSFRWALVSRAVFENLARTDPASLGPVERAHRLFYLLMAGWDGEMKHPRFQTAIRDAGHGNRLIGALNTLEARLAPVHARLQGVTLENASWEGVLQQHDSPTTFFYLDPPYPGNGVNYLHNLRDTAAHQRLADALGKLQGKWTLSTYDTPAMRTLYGQQHRAVPVRCASSMATAGGQGRVPNREILICNFDPADSC